MSDCFDLLGAAAHRKLRAQEELRAANAALATALRKIHSVGIPKCKVGSVSRYDLALHGFEEEQIKRLGLSDANIRLVLDQK